MASLTKVRKKRDEIVSFLKEKDIVASVGIIKAELGNGLKISFRDKPPSTVCSIILSYSDGIKTRFEVVGPIKPFLK